MEHKISLEKVCPVCKNVFIAHKKNHKFCSCSCNNKNHRMLHPNRGMDYYWANREKRLAYHKKWAEKNKSKIHSRQRIRRLGTWSNGEHIHISVFKRDYPKDGLCELCHGKNEWLKYHHWGEIRKNEKIAGVWVCEKCHRIIEHPQQALYILEIFQIKKAEIDQTK